jgi:alkane 1-monooxygenase
MTRRSANPTDSRWPDARFFFAWLLPIGIGLAILAAPLSAFLLAFGFQVLLAVTERAPFGRSSPPPVPVETAQERGRFRLVLWGHAVLQGGLLALALAHIADFSLFAPWTHKLAAALLLGLAVGTVSGGQGITYAHELGHSRRRIDRGLAWLLMASVNYSHFMVEHYRGHHPRAATDADPATARRGESLWQFLPRTLSGSLESAWVLEGQRLAQHRKDWSHSPLLWVTVAQVFWLVALGLFLGPWAVLFWLVQSAYAVFQLETVNYIEHYGLMRRTVPGGLRPKPEAFGVNHAWNADHWLTNAFIANLQRHSDHHMHAWKPYPALDALPGPQLPTGYAGCLFLAAVPGWWFEAMHPRLDALADAERKADAPG